MYYDDVSLPRDPSHDLSNSFAFLTKIKYGGPIGKIAAVGITFFVTLCFGLLAAWGNLYLVGGIVVVAFLSLIFLISRIEAVFKSNPEMATLEGREVIQYRQIELKSKNHAPIPVVEKTTDPELPQVSPPLLAGGADEKEDD